MRAVVVSFAAAGALGVSLAVPALAAPAVKLSPGEIAATFFNGQPFTAASPANVKFKMTFTADRKMKREPLGSGRKGEGT